MKRISDDRIAFYESQAEKQPTAVGSGESFNSFKEKFLSQGISVISERGVFESREYLRKFGQYIARTFTEFSAPERRQLAERARRAPVAESSHDIGRNVEWNEERAALPLPLLRKILGFGTEGTKANERGTHG